jgi:ABC-2 type transport system ATP-binding protein
MNALEISNLTKSYKDKEVLHDLNLTIKSGEFFGLLGQNGAGKSTTINCITGISTFNQGQISVFGHNVNQEYQITRAKIGLAPQEFNMDIFAPITKILDYVGGYFGMKKTERNLRIDELLTQFDLQEHRNKEFRQLSGGLKRRLTLARAMMHDPDLLILDEPTAGVDVEQRYQLWEYLSKLHEAGKTIILTSHYIEEVEKLCSKVAILHKGEIISTIDQENFRSNGDSLETQYLKATKK